MLIGREEAGWYAWGSSQGQKGLQAYPLLLLPSAGWFSVWNVSSPGRGGSLWEVSLKLWMSEFLSDGGKQEPSTLVIFVTRCFLLCFQPKPALFFMESLPLYPLHYHHYF